ncbi:MAG: HalOD1 output domain-containing protein [Haloferacaceae archaeon]
MQTNGQSTVYRSSVPVVDARYEEDGDATITEVLVEALAEAEGEPPTDLDPLYEVVDPEALSRLVGDSGGEPDGERLVAFAVENWNVFVRADGRIRTCDRRRTTDPVPVFVGPSDPPGRPPRVGGERS